MSESIGYARRVLNGARFLLEFSIGPGGRHSRLTDGTQEDELLGHGDGLFEYRISPNSTFSESVTVEGGENGTVTESITALKAQVINNLAVKLSFTLNHNTKPPEGTKKANALTAMTLVYGF